MSAWLRALWARWNRLWFRSVDGTSFALVRIGVSVAGWVLWFGTLPLLRHFYSNLGEFPISAARRWGPEYVTRFLMPDVLGSYPWTVALFALWGLALVGLTIGYRTRLAAAANWVLWVWFFYRNPTFANGGDEIFRITSLYLALGYLVIAPGRRALTLDRRRAAAGGSAPAPLMPAWPLRFVQIQIALLYFTTGFWKLMGSSWWTGSALYYALGNNSFSRWGVPHAAWLHPIFLVLTLCVAWWEFLFPVLVLRARTRLPALAFGVTMHLMILLLMYVGVFSFIMIGCYPAFLTADEAHRIVRWIERRAQPSSERSSAAAGAVSS